MPTLFLEWNAEDPVSPQEIEKNAVAELRQGNRNPFVDNPWLATAIWGGPEAEDTWGLSQFDFNPSSQVFPNGVLLTWNATEDAVGCEIRGGGVGGNDPRSITIVNQNPTNYFVSSNQLGNGGNFQWRVRCATGINPVQGITEFSDYDFFGFSPGIMMENQPDDLIEDFNWK
jgi:hypothetical protein